ncbi:MAG: hypothetical protein ABIH24_11305 [Verrucomicrobiota bacterium]
MTMTANDPMHQIRYDNAFSDWSEALPLGNGYFGASALTRGVCSMLIQRHPARRASAPN